MSQKRSVREFKRSVMVRDWFVYVHVASGLALHVDRRLLAAAGRQMPELDVPAALAGRLVRGVGAAIGHLDPGQREVHLRGLLEMTVHYGVLGGTVYVSDRPLMPYR